MPGILDKFKLNGRVAIVTGGGRGLGYDISTGLAEAGARIAVLGRDLSAGQECAGQIERNGGEARAFSCDVTDWESVGAAVDAVFDQFGRVDILINNAGYLEARPLLDCDVALLDQHFRTNLYGPLAVARAVVARVNAAYPLSIINISTHGAHAPESAVGPYNASKAALENLTLVMALEWTTRRVRANCVAPGTLNNAWNRELGEIMPDVVKGLRDATILKRFGDQPEIVPTILLLASDAGSYITGETFQVSAGAKGRHGYAASVS